ncbi:Sphingoid long-chain base transporter RSB1 [Lachnellula suecica]|uniref:Sphingoid long-chain base transporter RSB1 n=1 Tax=Lachnellula suecica TaxID=602035 RepID=A0A8T9CB13_9HELO|nr:Sphingoid long-chain base transporter RSB1 [Lachnellula suecica]
MEQLSCTEVKPQCPVDGSPLGYPPNLAASVVFTTLFGISIIGHIVLGWKYKTWAFLIAMLLGLSIETLGYLGRVSMHFNPYNLNSLLIQIVALSIAPTFYNAGLYLCLSKIYMQQLIEHSINRYGEDISRFRPIWYTRFFISCDIISLTLQTTGGGIVSSSARQTKTNLGNHILLAGLTFQIISLVFFAAACIDLTLRIRTYPLRKNPRNKALRGDFRFRGFLWAAVVSFSAIFIRCVYRVIELGGGWNPASNHLMREETPFILLESCMITIAVFALLVFHPGYGHQYPFDKPPYESTNGTLTAAGSKDSIPWSTSSNSVSLYSCNF